MDNGDIVISDEELRGLLLHQLDSGRREQLEAMLFDSDLAERLQMAEYDLLDDYVRGCLTPWQRECVERHLLVTRQDAARLDLARALQDHRHNHRRLRRHGRALRRARGWLLVAGLAALAILLRPELLTVPDVATDRVTISLLDEQRRGAALPRLIVPDTASRVRVQVEIAEPGPNAHYELRISDPTGDPDGQVLAAATSSEILTAAPFSYAEFEFSRAALGNGVRQFALYQSGTGSLSAAWRVEILPAE